MGKWAKVSKSERSATGQLIIKDGRRKTRNFAIKVTESIGI